MNYSHSWKGLLCHTSSTQSRTFGENIFPIFEVLVHIYWHMPIKVAMVFLNTTEIKDSTSTVQTTYTHTCARARAHTHTQFPVHHSQSPHYQILHKQISWKSILIQTTRVHCIIHHVSWHFNIWLGIIQKQDSPSRHAYIYIYNFMSLYSTHLLVLLIL
jgi:hypothetical protein